MFYSRTSFAFLIFALISTSIARAQNTADKNAAGTTTGKYKSLKISRPDLITGLSSIDSLFKFKEVAGTKGLPKLTAKGSYGTRVEITGSEDGVSKAQWTVTQPASGNLNKLAFTRMAFFVNMIGKAEAAAWFFEQLNNYNRAPALPQNTFYLIDGGRIAFIYDPLKKMFTIIATAE